MASMVSSSPLKSSNKNYSYNNNPSSNKGSSRISYIIFSNQETNEEPNKQLGRREIILRTSEIAVLGAIFHFGGKKPNYLGVQKNPQALALCPATNNCISTSEDVSDLTHYAPPWSYNPENGRGKKKPVSREEAMNELIQVFVDDVEFWFPPGKNSTVEYRSASRFGNFDFEVNKKRIKALRVELEKKGWASVGTF
ncbi:uncharacterized protein LOC113302123 isoform X2 [Papaver somniferum]|uniref:uncharacterized protein LOC113302123 isoform X2 n=1 Tax=Papaver somniferum TaxID=3469 RepID=UPI000E6FE3E4|nr:uncharacterized protein LOC113302123 isoform X2 [Papaver somniferum]